MIAQCEGIDLNVCAPTPCPDGVPREYATEACALYGDDTSPCWCAGECNCERAAGFWGMRTYAMRKGRAVCRASDTRIDRSTSGNLLGR